MTADTETRRNERKKSPIAAITEGGGGGGCMWGGQAALVRATIMRDADEDEPKVEGGVDAGGGVA